MRAAARGKRTTEATAMEAAMKIDFNCDMGEGFGIYTLGNDEEAMSYVSSVNLACGFHASNPMIMRRTVKMAREKGVAIGAHPSYPDLVGFGRRLVNCSASEIEADVIYQIGALLAFCRAEGVEMQHVKAHGALYNQAAADLSTARAIARAIKAVDSRLFMICQSGSAMVKAAAEAGVRYVEEAFADRAYSSEGLLLSRRIEGSVVLDPGEIIRRVLYLVERQAVQTLDGVIIPVKAGTICVHGDTPGALRIMKEMKTALLERGIEIAPFGSWL